MTSSNPSHVNLKTSVTLLTVVNVKNNMWEKQNLNFIVG